MQFSHRDCSYLPDIWVLILETLPEWLTEVLSDLFHPDAAHGPYSKSSDQRIRILTILHKCVESHDGHVGLGLGIVHQVVCLFAGLVLPHAKDRVETS